MPIKTLGSLGKIRVGRVTGNTHFFLPYQKAFIHGPLVPGRVGFHSVTSDPRIHAGGGARGKNLVHLQKLGFFVKVF